MFSHTHRVLDYILHIGRIRAVGGFVIKMNLDYLSRIPSLLKMMLSPHFIPLECYSLDVCHCDVGS